MRVQFVVSAFCALTGVGFVDALHNGEKAHTVAARRATPAPTNAPTEEQGYTAEQGRLPSKTYQDVPPLIPSTDRDGKAYFGATSKAWDGVDLGKDASPDASKQFFGFSYRPMFARVFPRPRYQAPVYLNSLIGGNNYNARLLANRWLAAMNDDDPDRIRILTVPNFFAIDNGVRWSHDLIRDPDIFWAGEYAVANWCCKPGADDSDDCLHGLLTKETFFLPKPDGFVLEFEVRDKDNNSGRCIVKTGFLSIQVNKYGKSTHARVYWIPSASNCLAPDYAYGSGACSNPAYIPQSLFYANQATFAPTKSPTP